jgi:hypothetical protein
MNRNIIKYAATGAALASLLVPVAVLAITQPTVPPGIGGQQVTGSSAVRIINDVVQIIVTVSVVIAIGFFIWGAIQYVGLGKPEDGKATMKKAALGLALMLAVGLIVNTIAGFINRGLNVG